MSRQEFPPREVKKVDVKGEKPDPGFEQESSPEATNHDHAQPIGTRSAVPGAGVVSRGADAGPVESNPDTSAPQAYPGQGTGPLNAPNATRPGTTRSGPAAVPSGALPGGSASASIPSETVTEGGQAPLSVPTDSVGPQPPAPDVPELYDPNFTAASVRGEGRGSEPPSAPSAAGREPG